jgi:uncharacterized protein with PQ loop repeat
MNYQNPLSIKHWLAFAAMLMLAGCEGLQVANTQSLLLPQYTRSEILGFVAGFGTTFAVLPDLIAMLRRKSTQGMNPRMAAITGSFQVLWIWYGLVIDSRPVMLWNLVGVLTNFFSVSAYWYFSKKEKREIAATRDVTAGHVHHH